MNRYRRNIGAFLIVALFLGAYLYIRHDWKLHEAMTGASKRGVAPHASREYEKYFGQLPDIPLVDCVGLVIYFPAREGEYLVPYPFFLTATDGRGRLIAETLLSDLPLGSMGDYVRPLFNGRGELESAEFRRDTATLMVRLPGKVEEADLAIAARLFLMAYSQVEPDVTGIVVDAGRGQRVADDIRSPSPFEFTVQEPGQPLILDAFLVADGESEISREIRIIFDRPIAVKAIRVEKAGGERVQGKFYLSEFSMAVILRAEGPLAIERGERFSVIYDIHDYRGRKSEGDRTFVAVMKRLAEEKR